jgi:hypothetical protein
MHAQLLIDTRSFSTIAAVSPLDFLYWYAFEGKIRTGLLSTTIILVNHWFVTFATSRKLIQLLQIGQDVVLFRRLVHSRERV